MKHPAPKKFAKRPKVAPEGDAMEDRADRPAFKRGGAVKAKGASVNIIIGSPGSAAPQGAPQAPGAPPLGMAAGAPVSIPVGPPPGAPMGAGGPPGLPPMSPASAVGPAPTPTMANGGRMTAGAGTGLGRLQKCR